MDVEGRRAASLTARTGGRLLPGWQSFSLTTAQKLEGRTALATNAARAHLRRAKLDWDFPADGPLAYMRAGRPLFSVELDQMGISFGLSVQPLVTGVCACHGAGRAPRVPQDGAADGPRPAAHGGPRQAKTPRPIVYTVVIDGLDGDRVDAGRAPFISSLLAGQDARATYYRESRSIMVAETNPNHTAMITGAYADRSGIPGNSFAVYGKLDNEDTCKRSGRLDETRLPTVTSGVNPGCIQAETVFGAVRRQGNPDGLVTAGVFGKPKLGRLFAGGSGSASTTPTTCGPRAPTTRARTTTTTAPRSRWTRTTATPRTTPRP